jgi:hypothetical protein
MKKLLILNCLTNLNWQIHKVEEKINFSIASKTRSEIPLSAACLWSAKEAA